MRKTFVEYKRSDLVESVHKVKVLVSNLDKKILINSGHNNNLIYPRSSIKIFQAIPFINVTLLNDFKINKKKIALSCSSHRGENFHINELREWTKKISINANKLQCGIHSPLNLKANEKLYRSNLTVDQLHNNCAGKHLAMITSCIINNYNIKNYLDFDHPHQIEIRKVFEKFSNKKIMRKQYGVDGCSAPQYSFKISDICNMLINLIKSYKDDFYYSNEVKILINSILQYPNYIGGTDSLDSRIMSISKNNIFCKGGAEGVFLFAHLKKDIVGVIKIVDGNERAIPFFIFDLFKKFKIMNKIELQKLNKYYSFHLNNHANISIGSINTKL